MEGLVRTTGTQQGATGSEVRLHGTAAEKTSSGADQESGGRHWEGADGGTEPELPPAVSASQLDLLRPHGVRDRRVGVEACECGHVDMPVYGSEQRSKRRCRLELAGSTGQSPPHC